MKLENNTIASNLYRRYQNLSRKDKATALREKIELEQILSGKKSIYRNKMCKNCKIYCRMEGKIKIINKTDQIERIFICTECGLKAHRDYIQNIGTRALKIN